MDHDLDGFTVAEGDCDDFDPAVGPAEAFSESCDGLDNDCTGEVDVDTAGVRVCARHDRFVQSLALDMLLVVDRSPSATSLVADVAEAVPDLIQHLVGPRLDTHIGVVSMDMSTTDYQGRLVELSGRRFVSGSTDSALVAGSFLYRALTELGAQVVGQEGGRAALDAALFQQADSWNAGFARNSTPLVVLFVTDQEDPTTHPSVPELLEDLDAARGLSRITMHAVVQEEPYDCLGYSAPQDQGQSYLDLVSLTGGFHLSMCDKDYSAFLSAIGQYAATEGLQTRFLLGAEAQFHSIEVVVRLPDGGGSVQLEPTDYALTDGGRMLVLLGDPLPPAGSEIIVDYEMQY
ncbi:MAG: hypothetical protein KC621_23720 [Myxococcales bacterium]|nr:hypothetical protein [Myxococcales bacterium]